MIKYILSIPGYVWAPQCSAWKVEIFCYYGIILVKQELFPGSAAVAQLAVNELVVGSNPTRGVRAS